MKAEGNTPPSLDITVELISPEVAHKYLGYNTHNRKLRTRTIAAYAADMRDGRWEQNGDSIKFNRSGSLDDGQHRLAAIIESETSVYMLVVRGLSMDAQDTIDGGISRKFADVLSLHGEKESTTLGAVVRSVYLWQSGIRTAFGGGAGAAITTKQLLECLEQNPWIRDEMSLFRRLSSHAKLPASVSGALVFAFNQSDADDASFFFDRLTSDQGHRGGEPAYELRKLLLASTDVRGTRSLRYLAAVTIKAWNKYRLGESCYQLRFRTGGANPESFPEVK